MKCLHPKNRGNECPNGCPPANKFHTYIEIASEMAEPCEYMEGYSDEPMKEYSCQKCNTIFQDFVAEYGTIICPKCDFVVFRGEEHPAMKLYKKAQARARAKRRKY